MLASAASATIAEFGAQLARRLAPSLQEYLLLLPSMEFLGSRSVRITPTNATSTQPDFIPVLNMFPLSNWSTRHIMFYSLVSWRYFFFFF